MALYQLILRLARNPGFPDGDLAQGYIVVAPLDGDDRLDAQEWRQHRDACTVTRFAPGTEHDAEGWLTHRGDNWFFHYNDADSADEGVFKLSHHRLAPGDYVTVHESDDQVRVYRIDQRTSYRAKSPAQREEVAAQ